MKFGLELIKKVSILKLRRYNMPLYYNSNDETIKRIISRCITLHQPYKPPWWCFWSPWINVFVMLIKEKFASKMPLQRDTIICPDGGKN